jgi:hypothetical protein
MSERKSLLAKTEAYQADNIYSARKVLADPEHFGPCMAHWAELIRARFPKEFLKPAASVEAHQTDVRTIKAATKHRVIGASLTTEVYGQASLF